MTNRIRTNGKSRRMAEVSRSGAERMDRIKLKIKNFKHYRLQMAGLMLFADLCGFGLAGVLVYLLNQCLHVFVFEPSDLKYLLVVLLCLALFMPSRLYPGIGLSPPEEMRLVTQFVSISFLIGLVFFNVIQPGLRLNCLALLPAWGISLVIVLFSRWGVRILSVRLGLWGEPVVVVSRKERLGTIVRYFRERGRLGFLPVLGVTELTNNPSPSPINLLDVEDFINLPDDHFAQKDIYTAVVGTRILSDLSELNVHRDLLHKFKRLIFVSDMDWLEGASISFHDFEGMLGMEAQQNLLTSLDVIVKRAMDILLSTLLGLVALPISFLAALWIRLDLPGPIFYSQERLGRDRRKKERQDKGRRKILIYKFRSMRVNADQVLAEYLANNPQARLEWEQTQKLKDDPRLTRVGKWLRKFSIDELPQLYNVLKGEMSLVGPRPIVEAEAHHYGDHFVTYTSVRPGLTGLWQVSGRNRTSYPERVGYDAYYVHNWSVWLDVYIMLRTIWVVLNRDGAY